MKKIKLMGLMVLLVFICTLPAYAKLVEKPNLIIAVDGKVVAFPDQLPVIDDNADRILIPVRFPSETLGAEVGWNNSTREVTITNKAHDALKDVNLKMKINSKNIEVSGERKQMDVAPIITGDRTMVPLRFISEYLGAIVEWWDKDGVQGAFVFTKGQSKEEQDKIIKEVIEKKEPVQPGVKKVYIDCSNAPVTGKYERDKYPEFIVTTWPTAFKFVSKDESCYRFVCTSHEGLNETYSAPFGSNVKQRARTDIYCYGDHMVANGLGYLTKIEKGMTIKYDIFNEAGKKIYEMTFQM